MSLSLRRAEAFIRDFDHQFRWYLSAAGESVARRAAPFEVHLIFYRYTETELLAERIMSGRRDLPRRLREPPGFARSAD